MKTVRADEEIERVENWCMASLDSGSHYKGMTYEEGIMDILRWLRGDEDCAPDQE